MKKKIKIITQLFLFLFPWILRRPLLNTLFKYNIHKTARIGFSIILADTFEMEEGAKITNFTFINNINNCLLKAYSKMGSFNWVTGANKSNKSIFQYSSARVCELVVGVHTRITEKHFFDCNGGVYVGDFTTIAGMRTVIMSHSIDVKVSRQTADTISIGKYCFIGTNSILLKGCAIPDYCVLGAGSVVTKKFEAPYSLYGGNPAKLIKPLHPEETLYFSRTHGHVS